MSAPAEKLLARLDGVQSTGKGWRAYCPNSVHEKQKRSLAITESDDGRLLLFCFSCCDTGGILESVGLTLGDLFERPIASQMTPAQKRDLRERHKQNQWKAALQVLPLEITVVLLCVRQLCDGTGVTTNDYIRLKQAVQRIADAKAVLCERP